jgi:hypothetical protein
VPAVAFAELFAGGLPEESTVANFVFSYHGVTPYYRDEANRDKAIDDNSFSYTSDAELRRVQDDFPNCYLIWKQPSCYEVVTPAQLELLIESNLLWAMGLSNPNKGDVMSASK